MAPARAPQANRRKPSLPLVALVLVAVIGAVFTTAVLLHRDGASLSGMDRPNGMQRPLPVAFTTTDPTGGPSYEIRLPQSPEPNSVASEPTADGWVSFAGVRLAGEQFGALLLVKLGNSSAKTPEGSLEQETRRAGESHALTPEGSIRKTKVGTTPAYAEDFRMANGRELREFRFARSGHLYGAGIVYYSGDQVSLATGLASLETLRWIR